MRALVIGMVVAGCSKPLQPPRPVNDPNAVNGCRPSPIELGGTRYTCTTYETYDQLITAPRSIATFAGRLVRAARESGLVAREVRFTIPGVEDSIQVEYTNARGAHAFDIVAMQPTGPHLRHIYCHMTWFQNDKTRASREDTCKEMITMLLARPAPPLRDSTQECMATALHILELPGHPEGIDDRERAELDFIAGCTPRIAACGRAARTFVEATLCRD